MEKNDQIMAKRSDRDALAGDGHDGLSRGTAAETHQSDRNLIQTKLNEKECLGNDRNALQTRMSEVQRSTHEVTMVVRHGSLKSRERSRSPVIQVEARCEKCQRLKGLWHANARCDDVCCGDEIEWTKKTRSDENPRNEVEKNDEMRRKDGIERALAGDGNDDLCRGNGIGADVEEILADTRLEPAGTLDEDREETLKLQDENPEGDRKVSPSNSRKDELEMSRTYHKWKSQNQYDEKKLTLPERNELRRLEGLLLKIPTG